MIIAITGGSGFLVPVRSSKLLEEAMLKLVNNDKLRNEMGSNARKHAIYHFSQDNITLEILQLYKRLIKE
jgi:glycosyltransferase involved in cell wall biosynthesis